MLARNPKTGGTIRIIQSDASLWRDQKTLVWSDGTADTERKIRFETGTTSSATAAGQDIILLLGPLEEEAAWLRSEAAEKPSLVGITKALVEAVGLAELAKLRLPNLLCLDEIHELYPFVGPAWDGSVEDAKAIVAAALRFARSGPTIAPTRAAVVEPLGITYFGPEAVPASPPLWFITQYYTPEKRRRAVELRRCLEKNIACDAIDRIILLNEKPIADPLVKVPKVHEVIIGQRLTYAKVLQWVQEEAPEDAIIVFANADIYLDAESFGLLWSVGLEDRCLALLRWDERGNSGNGGGAALDPVLFGPRADSQDAWVVTAASVKKRQWQWPALSFPFGQGGCDNAFALEMFKQKFLVANPALSLRTIHVHESGVRGYDPKDIVDKPAYLYIQPTGLHDLQPIYTIPKELIAKTVSREAVERRIEGPLSEAQAKTFATMVTRSLGDKGSIEYGSANRWAPGPLSLEKRSRLFQTRDGLRFTTNSLLIGPTKAARELWTNVQLSTMAASVHTERAFIAPLSKEIIASPGRYMLEYLSKIFLMREQVPEWSGAEFWASRAKPIMEALQLFQWGKDIPVLAYDDTPQAWCEEALIWPHEESAEAFVSAEQVGALRRALKQEWYPEPAGLRRIVVAVDGAWIQESLVDELEKAFASEGTMIDPVWPTTSIDVLVSKLRGAAGLIVSSGVGSFAWALPTGATVWEVQSEMAPSVSLLHLAAAGGLKHRLTIVPKAASPSAVQLADLTGKLLKDMATLEAAKKLPPLVVLPAATSGFFAHAGDSFREMVRLWESSGYVRVEHDPKATQVWLGGIGQVLLYDRPTLEWLRAAPKEELMWRKALFGNPPALKRESSWFFWPRRPELVERLAGTGGPWSERSGTVFYGKVENAVQAANRVETWKEACDTWVLAKGGEAYVLTQEEYLRALGRARFGLCLAGYGNKCHREIECMAMGTVPICAAEVDMEHYADPPVEGVHYLRASGPAAARAATEAITQEKWSAMSAACQEWWRRNASVAGSWELTRRLADAA